VSGAALMSRREVYLRLGGLDEGFFMHWEDADYCRRVHDCGLAVRYLTAARARHAEGSSRGGWPIAQVKHFHRGAYRYYAKHHLAHGSRRLARPLAAAALGARAAALSARSAAKR
jgi:GT2 family glycosyltransferase